MWDSAAERFKEEKQTILDDIIFSEYLYILMTRVADPLRHSEFSSQISEPGVPAFWREKLAAAPICHQLSGQISLFFTGSQQDGWGHFITAAWGHSGSTALHASLTASPPPTLPPYSYHQGSVKCLWLISTASTVAAYFLNWIMIVDTIKSCFVIKYCMWFTYFPESDSGTSGTCTDDASICNQEV